MNSGLSLLVVEPRCGWQSRNVMHTAAQLELDLASAPMYMALHSPYNGCECSSSSGNNCAGDFDYYVVDDDMLNKNV
jgi:hypothetical protein